MKMWDLACRYIPVEGDSIIGIITDRFGESWNVDIRGPFTATLGALSFEGVTRRSRPNLRHGDLVYARVTQAPRDADPTLVCTDADGLVTSCQSSLHHSHVHESSLIGSTSFFGFISMFSVC